MNIRQRILASGAIGIVAVVLLGGVGFWGQLRLGKALSENELSVNALRNHMEGDMMHDALRADVLAAFVVQPGDGAAAGCAAGWGAWAPAAAFLSASSWASAASLARCSGVRLSLNTSST